MTLIDQIRDMISEGETEKSLEELYIYVKENNADIIDNLVMLRSRMRNLQHSVQMGTMSNQDAAFERAKINEAILKLLPQLTPEYLAQASKRREPIRPHAAPPPPAAAAAPAPVRHSNRVVRPAAAPTESKAKYYIIGGVVAFFLLFLVGLCSNESTSGSTYEESSAPVIEESAPAAQYTNTAPTASETAQNTYAEAASPSTLLDQVVAAYNGYTVWQAEENGTLFIVDAENGTCQEMGADGTVCCNFEVKGSDANYLTLYDASRSMRLRVSLSEMLIRHDGDPSWRTLYHGHWTSPNE